MGARAAAVAACAPTITMKHWTPLLNRLLRLAMRGDARLFEVEDHRRDGAVIVRPTRDVRGIGGRLARAGVLPADAPEDEIDILFEVERADDPIWEVRYLHLRWRTGRGFGARDAKLAVGWPLKNTDLVLLLLGRALRETYEAARAVRALAAKPGRGLVVDSVRPVPGNGGQA